MKIYFASLLPLLTLLASAGPLPGADAAPAPVAEPEAAASPGEALNILSRRDKFCRVFTGDGNVACRKGAGSKYDLVRRIGANDRFGVNCKANGERIVNTNVWDWVPGWECWVTAYYTRAITAGDTCESNVPWC